MFYFPPTPAALHGFFTSIIHSKHEPAKPYIIQSYNLPGYRIKKTNEKQKQH